MSDTKDTPEWMTDEWLHSAKLLTDSPTWEWSKVAGAAREILRLRAESATLTAELAKVTDERDDEVERLKESLRATEMGYEQLRDERDAAIRDRSEFAAQQLDLLAADYHWRALFCQDLGRRAAELRKTAGAPDSATAEMVEPFVLFKFKAAGAAAPAAPLPNPNPSPAGSWRKARGALKEVTPAADARQPDIDRLLDYWLRRQNEADSSELAIDHTDADAARRAIHDAIAARLAASEKARADLLHALVCRSDPLQGAAYQCLADRTIAAERAGGAS